jgi:hypothetical protein
MERETTATALVLAGAILIPLAASLIGGLPWALLAAGIEGLIVGLALGWE